MPIIDFRIVYLVQVFALLVLLYFGRHVLKKRIFSLFCNAKIPRLYLFGFRLLLGISLLGRLYVTYFGSNLLIIPTSFFRVDKIFELFFKTDYKFLILIIIPLIFVVLFSFKWKPRLTSTIAFLYSVIADTLHATVSGKISHEFHMTALLLFGFMCYYWFYYKPAHVLAKDKRKEKRLNEWMIFPILLFFIGTIYGSSFISKTSHLAEVPKWFTGEAMQSAIIKGHFQRVLTFGHDKDIGALSPIPQFVVKHKPLAAFLGIGALLLEFSSLLLLVVSSRLRLIILIGLVFFNVGSGLLVLVDYFTWNIIALMYLTLLAVYNMFPVKIASRKN